MVKIRCPFTKEMADELYIKVGDVITDAQHGDKTSIKNAHHIRTHTHVIPKEAWYKTDETETSIDSSIYATLLETIAKPHIGQIMKLGITAQFRNIGTPLDDRGIVFKVQAQDDYGSWDVSPEYNWQDYFDLWKVTRVSRVNLVVDALGNMKFKVLWKARVNGMTTYAKTKFFGARSFEYGGDIQTETP